MTRRPDAFDLDAEVTVDKIPANGRTIVVEPDAAQREALADRLKVIELPAFSARLMAKRFRGGIRVEGRVHGTVIQPCVVTGDPVSQDIDEEVDRVFLPGYDEASEAPAGAEIFVNLEDDDLPDYFEGDEIDLADLVLEVFALAIDLYPRKPGAEIEGGIAGDDPADVSPFSVLKALKGD